MTAKQKKSKTTKPRRAARSREKGHEWENEVAGMLRKEWGVAARRGLQYQEGHDVSDVVTLVPLHIECKHRAVVSAEAALAQAEADSQARATRIGGAKRVPVAVTKKDRKKPTIHMRLDDFLSMMSSHPWVVSARAEQRLAELEQGS